MNQMCRYQAKPFPVVFWDLFGEQGHPIRTTISEMGPLLLSRLLGLNDTQEGVMSVCFEVADDQGMLLLDLNDLRALLHYVGEHSKEFSLEYGNVSSASVGAIQRRLLTLEQQGGEAFFGEPALKIEDLMRSDLSGQGIVNILAADQLMQSPKLYATFLLWLLSELFEELPEVGDPDKPKLVFFFDEAHLLFDNAPKALVQKVEQVVRLIRSKGVGVYFVTQNPLDIPDEVLGQLGNRVQHALRAFTPRDRKAVKAAAETFRANPRLDVATAITELGVGEALVSTLAGRGVPSVVERTLIRPPCSRMGPATRAERARAIGPAPGTGGGRRIAAESRSPPIWRLELGGALRGQDVSTFHPVCPGAEPAAVGHAGPRPAGCLLHQRPGARQAHLEDRGAWREQHLGQGGEPLSGLSGPSPAHVAQARGECRGAQRRD